MSLRLTNEIRDNIVNAVCKAVVGQKVDSCAKRLDDIELEMAREVEAALSSNLGVSNFNTLKRFRSLVMKHSSTIFVKVPRGDSFKIKIPADVFIPTREWQYMVYSEDFETFPRLIEDRLAAIEALRLAKESQEELAIETRKIVYSVNTAKQLIERWPDVVKYYNLDAKGANLPACVDASELNNLITTLQQNK